MKLNLGCGPKLMEGFINVDKYQRSNTKLDVECDLSKEFPFEPNSCEFILMEQLLEHLEWDEGIELLENCYKSLKPQGKLRILIPNYKLLFTKYLENDLEYFKPFIESLNTDLEYYSRCYTEPIMVRCERKDNLPPNWHLSPKLKDRRLVKLRCRYYSQPIEVIDWFVHQYHEHYTIYDFDSIAKILHKIGFHEIKKTETNKDIDVQLPTRVSSSLCVEAVK